MPVNDYCTYEEVNEAVPDGISLAAYEDFIEALVSRASRKIDNFFKVKPGYFYVDEDETRYFDGNGESSIIIDKIATNPTSVSICEDGDITSYTDLSATDYYMYPYNNGTNGNKSPFWKIVLDTINGDYSFFPSFRKGLKVVGKFGYSESVPDDLKQAAIIQTIRFFKRGQQAYQDVGAIESFGQLKFAQELDPDVKTILRNYLDGLTI